MQIYEESYLPDRTLNHDADRIKPFLQLEYSDAIITVLASRCGHPTEEIDLPSNVLSLLSESIR